MDEEKVLDETQEEVVALDDENDEFEEVEEESESKGNDDESEYDESDDVIMADDVEDEPKEEEKSLPKPSQSKEENAKYAAARREAEGKERELRKKLNNIISQMGYESYDEYMSSNGLSVEEKNKLEKEAIEMGYDVDRYVDDYLDEKYSKILRKRDEAKRLKDAADEAEKERVKADLDNFNKNYPSIDVSSLLQDAKFKKFAKGKTSTQSLVEIYEDYTELFGSIREETVKKSVSKSQRSTGSGSSGSSTLNQRQRDMMENWNRRFPNNPMKPEDFK